MPGTLLSAQYKTMNKKVLVPALQTGVQWNMLHMKLREEEKSSGKGHGNPLQYSCLENPHGQRSLAGCSTWAHKESDTTEAA